MTAGAKRSWVHVIISCEHASNQVPARYADLGLSRSALRSHIAWDPGARAVARRCARQLKCSYHEGRHSRLLIDLNRSPHNRNLIPKESFGRRIPGNAGMTPFERCERTRRYYEPYREAVLSDIRAGQARGKVCAHFSLHSFTDQVRRRDRRVDIGVLYDPARALEGALALCLSDALKAHGLYVRRNYPYRGTSDGLTTHCRRTFPADTYIGIEIEINQRIIGRPDPIGSLSTALGTAIEAAVRSVSAHRVR